MFGVDHEHLARSDASFFDNVFRVDWKGSCLRGSDYTARTGYTVTQGAKAIPIQPGPLAGNQVSILDGLREGQRIVVSGANLLRPGDVVKEVQ